MIMLKLMKFSVLVFLLGEGAGACNQMFLVVKQTVEDSILFVGMYHSEMLLI